MEEGGGSPTSRRDLRGFSGNNGPDCEERICRSEKGKWGGSSWLLQTVNLCCFFLLLFLEISDVQCSTEKSLVFRFAQLSVMTKFTHLLSC